MGTKIVDVVVVGATVVVVVMGASVVVGESVVVVARTSTSSVNFISLFPELKVVVVVVGTTFLVTPVLVHGIFS